MSRQELIEHWRSLEVKETAALVVDDKALQKVLAAWPMVGVTDSGIEHFSPDDAASWDAVWSGLRVDLATLAQVAGLQHGPATLAFNRAKALRLIYPDGTVHATARMVLMKRIKDALSGGAR
ncbi:hypothetical protein FG147_02455 [Thauera sp. UPWRP]|nr:hypothetical protein FG147_02455 [Thauera sp. UPWRP]